MDKTINIITEILYWVLWIVLAVILLNVPIIIGWSVFVICLSIVVIARHKSYCKGREKQVR